MQQQKYGQKNAKKWPINCRTFQYNALLLSISIVFLLSLSYLLSNNLFYQMLVLLTSETWFCQKSNSCVSILAVYFFTVVWHTYFVYFCHLVLRAQDPKWTVKEELCMTYRIQLLPWLLYTTTCDFCLLTI